MKRLATVTNGLDRFSAIVQFNDVMFETRIDQAESPMLADIAYYPRKNAADTLRESGRLSKLVMDHIASTDWTKRYGLSYRETMKLSYVEWIRLQEAQHRAISAETKLLTETQPEI